MQIPMRNLTLAFVLYCLFILGASSTADAAKKFGESSMHTTGQWVQGSKPCEQGSVLYVFENSAETLISRVLVETPAGERFVLTQGLQPQHGEFFYTVLHEETGWWAEFRHDMGIQAETLGAFFEKGDLVEPERALALSLVTSGGRTWQSSIVEDPAAPQLAQRQFGQHLATTEAGRAMRDQLSPGMKTGLSFLQQALAPDPLGEDGLLYGVRLPIEVLTAVFSEAPSTEGAGWQLRIEPVQKGIYFHEPEILAFTAKFKSVENSDPLSDCRAADVAKGAVCGSHRRSE